MFKIIESCYKMSNYKLIDGVVYSRHCEDHGFSDWMPDTMTKEEFDSMPEYDFVDSDEVCNKYMEEQLKAE